MVLPQGGASHRFKEGEAYHLATRRRRSRAATGRDTAVGLGLSLAREIAHAHGGDLKVDTERGGWVRFTLELGLR